MVPILTGDSEPRESLAEQLVPVIVAGVTNSLDALISQVPLVSWKQFTALQKGMFNNFKD